MKLPVQYHLAALGTLALVAVGCGSPGQHRDAASSSPGAKAFAPPLWMRTATVEGRVIKAEGNGPLANARVELLHAVGNQLIPVARARTDAAGAYHVPMLWPGAFAVTGQLAGYARQQVFTWLLPGANRVPELRMGRSAVLGGAVIDELGHSVAGVSIEAQPRSGASALPIVGSTDASGRFLLDGLAAGIYTVRAAARGYRTTSLVDVRSPARGLRLSLVRLYAIRGVVSGAQASQARVQVVGSGLWPGRSVPVAADHTFLVEDVPAGVYELVAWSAGEPAMASEPVAGLQVGPHVAPPVLLALQPAQKIEGFVTRGDAPVAGATVALGQGTVSVVRYRVKTDAAGHFALDPVVHGTYQLGVWSQGYLPLVARELVIPATLPLKLELSTGASVSGEVVDDQGAAIVGATVRAIGGQGLATRPDATPTLGVVPGPVPPIPPAGYRVTPGMDGWSQAEATTDSQGRYVLGGLEGGRVRLIAAHPDYAVTRSDWIELAAQEQRAAPRLMLRPAARLTGQVLDERGWPLVGAQVTAVSAEDNQSTFTDSTGAYHIGGLEGALTVEATLQGYLPASARVEMGGHRDRRLDFVLEPAHGLLSGFVLDPSRLPVGEARIVAQCGPQRLTARTDRAGFFQLAGVGERELVLEVRHPDYLVARERIRPARDVEVQLAYGAGIAGRVVEQQSAGPVTRFDVELKASDGSARKVPIQHNDGAFAVHGVPPGPARLRVSAAGYAAAALDLEVPRPSRSAELVLDQVRVELRLAGSLSGRVTDRQGQPVAGATVEVAGLRAVTGPDGSFLLGAIPEGSHVVDVRAAASGSLRTDPVIVRANEIAGPLRLELP